MEDFIKVTVRFDDSNLLPAMALAAPQHQTAVQRTLTPLIYDVIQDLFRRAENDSRADERGLVRRFQEALRNVDEWDQVRRRLLIQLLTSGGTGDAGKVGDSGIANYIVDINVAFYSRMHVLCAASPDLAPLFAQYCRSNKTAIDVSETDKKRPVYRVQADCTPSSFVFAVCQAAAAYFCEDPFLFFRNVPAEQFIERRKRCLAKIDRVIEQVLYDRVAAMVLRLRRELMSIAPTVVRDAARASEAKSQPRKLFSSNETRIGESSIAARPRFSSRNVIGADSEVFRTKPPSAAAAAVATTIAATPTIAATVPTTNDRKNQTDDETDDEKSKEKRFEKRFEKQSAKIVPKALQTSISERQTTRSSASKSAAIAVIAAPLRSKFDDTNDDEDEMLNIRVEKSTASSGANPTTPFSILPAAPVMTATPNEKTPNEKVAAIIPQEKASATDTKLLKTTSIVSDDYSSIPATVDDDGKSEIAVAQKPPVVIEKRTTASLVPAKSFQIALPRPLHGDPLPPDLSM